MANPEMKPHVVNLDDGSILIEWASADARFFITIEPRLEESGWGYVTRDNLESGKLPLEFLAILENGLRK
jgi:hypothetical protein